MAAEVTFDVLEQILVRLDVKDIIRCKSVCKSWQSLISSSGFVKVHLMHAYKNDARRRIACDVIIANADHTFYCNYMYIVGSCNGLVCVSPRDVELEVTNPCTRETKIVQTPCHRADEILVMIRQVVCCMGFGYDCRTNDYKVIVGFKNRVGEERTLFHVLTLKSNAWKVIGEVKYSTYTNKCGFFCGGALHWLMRAAKKKVIMSLDLSTEECKEIPPPVETGVDFYDHRLGIIEECLCIYSSYSPSPLSSNIWILKNNTWEVYNNSIIKYDVAHSLTCRQVVDSQSYVYIHDDGRLVPSAGDYIRASMFVKSLVSPHPQGQSKGQVEGNNVKGNIKKRKKRKRSCKHKKSMVSHI